MNPDRLISSKQAQDHSIGDLRNCSLSESLVLAKYVKHLRVRELNNQKATMWTMPAGQLKVISKVKGQFTILELQEKKLIKLNLHVAKDMGANDMIIRKDILPFLEINI